jgi:4'-phosphopantetheinyl transferase
MHPKPVHGAADQQPLCLWYAYPDDLLAEEAIDACAPLLSEDERVRWRSFRFHRHSCEYLATRVLIRTALSNSLSAAPQAWRFSRNAYGKPRVDPERGLHFSLSNSLGLVACLIAQGTEVGLDAEPYERSKEIAELASKVFSPRELAQLEVLRDPEKLDRALSLWTLKEAYIKARGMGLSLPLQKFSFVFGGVEGIRLELDECLGDEAGRWRFCLLDHVGHRLALMAEHATAPALQLWEARPFPALPKRLTAERPLWFPSSTVSS